MPTTLRRAIHSAGTRCIPPAMLTQASWPGPPSSAPELAPTLAHLFIVDSTAVTPPKTPAMRAPLPPPKEDANPFGFHPVDVDGDSRFRLDECGCRFADGGSSDSDGPDGAFDEDDVAEYLEVDPALDAGPDENEPPSPVADDDAGDGEVTRRPLAPVDAQDAAARAGRLTFGSAQPAPGPSKSAGSRTVDDGTPLPPTCSKAANQFVRDIDGRYLCVVLDLDETLICAYNHEVNGGVPDELRRPEVAAKSKSFTLHKDPRHFGGFHGDEPCPLVASTSGNVSRSGDWARAYGMDALAERMEGAGGLTTEPVCTVFERPGVRDFLAELATFAEVVVFTAGMEGYARPLLDELDPRGDRIHHRLYRSACSKTPLRDHVKDIAKLGRDLSATVLVDNNPFSFLLQPHNGIPIVSFTGDPSDAGLRVQLMPMLRKLGEMVAGGEDVRPFCRRRFKMEPFLRNYFAKQGLEFDPPRELWEEELEREGTMPMREVGRRKRSGGNSNLLTSR